MNLSEEQAELILFWAETQWSYGPQFEKEDLQLIRDILEAFPSLNQRFSNLLH